MQEPEAGSGQVLADEGDSLLMNDDQSEAAPSERAASACEADLLQPGSNSAPALPAAGETCYLSPNSACHRLPILGL